MNHNYIANNFSKEEIKYIRNSISTTRIKDF